MAWCPNCKTKYREGFYVCSDCEADLVDEIKDAKVVVEDDLQKIDWEYLDVFADEQEADIIESFLNSGDIQTFKKYPGFSGMSKIVGGMTKLGVEIYVPKERLEDARLIAEDILSVHKSNRTEGSSDYEPDEDTSHNANSSPSSLFINLILIGALVYFVYRFFLST